MLYGMNEISSITDNRLAIIYIFTTIEKKQDKVKTPFARFYKYPMGIDILSDPGYAVSIQNQ